MQGRFSKTDFKRRLGAALPTGITPGGGRLNGSIPDGGCDEKKEQETITQGWGVKRGPPL